MLTVQVEHPPPTWSSYLGGASPNSLSSPATSRANWSFRRYNDSASLDNEVCDPEDVIPRCERREGCDGKRVRSGPGGCSGSGSSFILGNACGEVGDDGWSLVCGESGSGLRNG